MKNKLILAVALASAFTTFAQDADERPPGRPPGGPGGERRQPPIIAALDANHDGKIDATEIANASAVLAKLDKNGDGVLTPDEFMGMGPRGGGRGPGGPGGPEGRRPRPEGE